MRLSLALLSLAALAAPAYGHAGQTVQPAATSSAVDCPKQTASSVPAIGSAVQSSLPTPIEISSSVAVQAQSSSTAEAGVSSSAVAQSSTAAVQSSSASVAQSSSASTEASSSGSNEVVSSSNASNVVSSSTEASISSSASVADSSSTGSSSCGVCVVPTTVNVEFATTSGQRSELTANQPFNGSASEFITYTYQRSEADGTIYLIFDLAVSRMRFRSPGLIRTLEPASTTWTIPLYDDGLGLTDTFYFAELDSEGKDCNRGFAIEVAYKQAAASTGSNICTSAAFCNPPTPTTPTGQQQPTQSPQRQPATATPTPTPATGGQQQPQSPPTAQPQPPSTTTTASQTSPAPLSVCPAIQFTQTPTNTDVTFSALTTTHQVGWIDVHFNVLSEGQSIYPLNAPVENNNWFWNYRMEKTGDQTFHFTYTTGPNGFNFNPQTQRLQYFFTYGLELFACNSQSFVYSPNGQPATGASQQPQQQPQPATSPATGVCPAINFMYNVVSNNALYTINFNGQTPRSVQWVDVHINVLQPGQAPYPANAIVEANHWFWNYRMQSNENNAFTFPLTTGPNGINYAPPASLQFFFTYSAGLHLDCNTQSFIYNLATGALVTPPAPQPVLPNQPQTGGQQQPSTPVTIPVTAQNQTFCEKYSQQLFGSANSECYQTALFAAILERAAYGGAGVTGAFIQGQPLYQLFQSTIPYNGHNVDLSQFVKDNKYVAVVAQTVIEFFGRSFGCNAEGFPSFASNPDFVNSSYAYPDINAIRNVIKGLNLPQTFYDSINSQIVAAMKSMGVEQADIDSIVMPALNGFEQGLIGQAVNGNTNTVSSKLARLSTASNAPAHTETSFATLVVVALTALSAILF